MKLTCAFNRSSALPDEQRGRMADFEKTYPLTVGAEYVVAGMGLWESVLFALVRDDWGKPCTPPLALFEPGSDEMPDGWRFALYPGIRATGRELWVQPCGALWGYAELVEDEDHLGALAGRLRNAIRKRWRSSSVNTPVELQNSSDVPSVCALAGLRPCRVVPRRHDDGRSGTGIYDGFILGTCSNQRNDQRLPLGTHRNCGITWVAKSSNVSVSGRSAIHGTTPPRPRRW